MAEVVVISRFLARIKFYFVLIRNSSEVRHYPYTYRYGQVKQTTQRYDTNKRTTDF